MSFPDAAGRPERSEYLEGQSREQIPAPSRDRRVIERQCLLADSGRYALLPLYQQAGSAAEFPCEVGSFEQIANCGSKICCAMELQNCAVCQKIFENGREVLHAWANRNRAARGSRFNDVVSAPRSDGATHENGVRKRVATGEFPECIEQKYPCQR